MTTRTLDVIYEDIRALREEPKPKTGDSAFWEYYLRHDERMVELWDELYHAAILARSPSWACDAVGFVRDDERRALRETRQHTAAEQRRRREEDQ